MGLFRGYNPLILTFDPNFQRDIHTFPITFKQRIKTKIFCHENTSFKFTFFGAQRLDQYRWPCSFFWWPQVALYEDKVDVLACSGNMRVCTI